MQTLKEIRLADEDATLALGANFATVVQIGDVICLSGGLGAGKTTFARGFVRAAQGAPPDGEIPSPTFTLVQTYEAPAFTIWHFDLYRIESPDEVYELGVEEALDTGVSLIEWPEKAAGLLPAERLDIHFSHAEKGRAVRIAGDGAWARRLEKL